METKKCTKCSVEKPTNEFNKRFSWCKSCQKAYATNYNLTNWNIKIKGVYAIFDSQTSDCLYIGASDGVNRRISRHKTCMNNLIYAEQWHPSQLGLYKQLAKHKSVFFEILDECDKKIANKLEQLYIKIYNPKYNIRNRD